MHMNYKQKKTKINWYKGLTATDISMKSHMHK